jgi:hypothetical protein
VRESFVLQGHRQRQWQKSRREVVRESFVLQGHRQRQWQKSRREVVRESFVLQGHRKRIFMLKNAVFWDFTPLGLSEEHVASIIKVTRMGKL